MTTTPSINQTQPVSQQEHRAQMCCTASLVLGIVGLLLAWTPVLGLLAGIAAAAASVQGRKRLQYSQTHRSMAVGGLVLSIIAITLGTLSTAAWLFGAAMFAGWLQVPTLHY